ncbi:hypothetical protein BsWGS_18221 [Bradybaena similaris]
MAKRTRVLLTLEERVKVIKRSKSGDSSRKLAADFKVGKTQILAILKGGNDIIRRWEDGENGDRKVSKVRKSTYEEVNSIVWDWFCNTRARNIPVTGKMIQEQAVLVATERGFDDFSGSNGWLDRWRTRHNVRFGSLCGESGDVSADVVADWTKRLPDLCAGYELKDIFNADETGLFFRAFPNKSMLSKGDVGHGIKINKNRVTALVAVSATGEKLKPLIIGRSARPHSFRGCTVGELGIDYFHNKKAWMTRDIFTVWANKLNNKMRLQGRKILLLLDNCTAHPPLQLSNIKLLMLPPNSTSKLQPCDAGIIQTVKLNYRKRLLQHVLFKLSQDSTATGPQLANSVTLMDAVLWWKSSWDLLHADTIVKCFSMCGVTNPTSDCVTPCVNEVEGDSQFVDILPSGLTLNDFVYFDNDIQTCAEPNSENDEKEDADESSLQEEEIHVEEPDIDHKTAAVYCRSC